MAYSRSTPFVKRVSVADSLLSGVTGALLYAGATFLTPRLGLPIPLVRFAGFALLLFAAFVAVVATRERPQRAAIWAVLILNMLRVIGSIALLDGWLAPNVLGVAFVVAQALVVATFAVLQFIGLQRRTAPWSN